MVLNYAQTPISRVTAANGIEYAYRETGEGGVPLAPGATPSVSARRCLG
ncbi:hypothetical protein ACFXDH_20445 [Streptomyces sp. NPDC059467]